jgi:hypothetical protein
MLADYGRDATGVHEVFLPFVALRAKMSFRTGGVLAHALSPGSFTRAWLARERRSRAGPAPRAKAGPGHSPPASRSIVIFPKDFPPARDVLGHHPRQGRIFAEQSQLG